MNKIIHYSQQQKMLAHTHTVYTELGARLE